jgi:hypothetical protein
MRVAPPAGRRRRGARIVAVSAGGDEIRTRALEILHRHWDDERGHTYPNPRTYPHQWLWDSCFAAICWARLGDPDRGLRELTGALAGQLPGGFVPHMRYAGEGSGRGPRRDVSSFTQPPVYAHAARVLAGHRSVPAPLLARIGRGLDWLWRKRRTADGLLFLVHPWESGADDSPRWDTWAADFLGLADWTQVRWTRPDFTRLDHHLVAAASFDDERAAVWSSAFVSAPAAFNALAAHAAGEYAALVADPAWDRRARELAAAMDALMWNPGTGLWSDVPLVGAPGSRDVPTLDGVLGALATPDGDRAARALDQLASPARFAAPYGLAYVAREHPAHDPKGYWRGAGWMQMNYLARLAAQRWARTDLVDAVAAMSVAAARTSRFAEYWDVETGQGYGPVPMTWSALVATMRLLDEQGDADR